MKIAVYTLVRDEKEWLPVWVRYYLSQGFSPTDIYVLDQSGKDETAQQIINCNRFLAPYGKSWNHTYMTQTLEWFQCELLRKYDIVVLTDVDEVICADPKKWPTLIDYLQQSTAPSIETNYYNIIHDTVNKEPHINFSLPLLAQRHLWVGPIKGKTYISRVPLEWNWGCHKSVPPGELTTELRLIHGRWIDREQQIGRIMRRLSNSRDFGDVFIEAGANDRTTDVEFHIDEFKRVLAGEFKYPHDPVGYIKPTEIPAEWKSIVI